MAFSGFFTLALASYRLNTFIMDKIFFKNITQENYTTRMAYWGPL